MQELDEEDLDAQMARDAHSERQYDSDGSDDYQATQRPIAKGATAAEQSIVFTPPLATDTAPARPTAGVQTPATDPVPPWSQRAASYPPWSQLSGQRSPRWLGSATMPSWSPRVKRRSNSVRLAARSRSSPETMLADGEGVGVDQLEGEEEEEEENESREESDGDAGDDNLFSQLSCR